MKDPKDTEEYPAPALYHKIKCKSCGKSDNVRIRYTRNCNECRNHLERNGMQSEWKSWVHTPTIQPLGSRNDRYPDKPKKRVNHGQTL